MTQSIWQKHPDALEKARSLKKNLSWQEVANALSKIYDAKFTYNGVRNKLRRGKFPVQPTRKGVFPGGLHLPPAGSIPGRKTYLLLSDLHIPFELDGLTARVEQFVGFVDGVYIIGDLLDQYAVSSFPKNKEIALKQEFLQGYSYLEEWAALFPVVLLPGNHDIRLDTYLQKNLLDTVKFLFPTNFLLRQYVNGFTIREEQDDREVHYDSIKNLTVIDDWFLEVGDAILAHPLSFSAVDGRTADNVNKFFGARGSQHRAVIIGHTHRVIKVVIGKIGMLMEIGCNCKEMDYTKRGKVSANPRVQVPAMGILVQYDGKTDINETRVLTLEGWGGV